MIKPIRRAAARGQPQLRAVLGRFPGRRSRPLAQPRRARRSGCQDRARRARDRADHRLGQAGRPAPLPASRRCSRPRSRYGGARRTRMSSRMRSVPRPCPWTRAGCSPSRRRPRPTWSSAGTRRSWPNFTIRSPGTRCANGSGCSSCSPCTGVALARTRWRYTATGGAMIDELGLEPGLPLRRLHQRMLADEPASQLNAASEGQSAGAREPHPVAQRGPAPAAG